MIESQQISTTSTINDYPNLLSNKINIDEEQEQEKEEIPEWQKCKSKRFKNLVECYLCKVEDCQILFETKEELNEHKKTAHTELYKCNFPHCEKSFMKIINLRKHCKCHFKNKRRYFCPYEGCDKSFTASYSLTLHYRIHTGNTPYKCEKCGKKFFDRANYQYHVNNMHKKIISNKLICQHKNCGHKSKSIKQLLMHHDKLEEQCVKEKNLLLKLIMLYQNSSISMLNIENKENQNEELKNFSQQIGVDEEKKNLWISLVKNIELDDELKNELKLIEIQSKIVVDNSIDKNKYQGILESI
jgi:uncharacterized C2H2 Zn-finger protein